MAMSRRLNHPTNSTKLRRIGAKKPALIIVSAMAALQAALRPLFERFAAGRAGTSRRSTNHPNKSLGLAPKNRSAAVLPLFRLS